MANGAKKLPSVKKDPERGDSHRIIISENSISSRRVLPDREGNVGDRAMVLKTKNLNIGHDLPKGKKKRTEETQGGGRGCSSQEEKNKD